MVKRALNVLHFDAIRLYITVAIRMWLYVKYYKANLLKCRPLIQFWIYLYELVKMI